MLLDSKKRIWIFQAFFLHEITPDGLEHNLVLNSNFIVGLSGKITPI
jgi:hypothetical protein